MALRVLVRPIVATSPTLAQSVDVIITVWNQGNEYAVLEEMTCSWDTHYRFDHQEISIVGWPCTRNFLEMKILAPNQKVTHQIVSLAFRRPLPNALSFRIGLVQPVYKVRQVDLQKAYHSRGYPFLTQEDLQEVRKRPPQIVWSAPVRVHTLTSWQVG